MALGNFSYLQGRIAFRYAVALAFQLPYCCWVGREISLHAGCEIQQ